MTKRICPSCGLGAYSADTGRVWICEACNTEMPKSCEVEIERCKPDRLNEIRERAEKAKINVKDNPWWISTNVYISDVSYLLDEITRLRAELGSVAKLLKTVRDCHTCTHYIREYGMGAIECKKPCATTKNENYELRGTEVQGK